MRVASTRPPTSPRSRGALSHFAQALTGSPAFAVATALYTAAVKIAPPAPAVPAGLPGFAPD